MSRTQTFEAGVLLAVCAWGAAGTVGFSLVAALGVAAAVLIALGIALALPEE